MAAGDARRDQPRDGRRDRRIAFLVAIALFAVYVAVQRSEIKSYDGSIMTSLATRLLTKHTLTIDPATDPLHLQSPYASYGFGTTLLVLPFDWLQRAIHAKGASILTLANPAALAACGAVLYLIGRRLAWRRWVCAATGLGFGVLTTALWQSTDMFSEPGVTLCTLLIVLGLLVWTDTPGAGSLLVGIGIAGAALFRPDSLLLIAPLALAAPFMIPRERVFTRSALVRVAVPIAIVGAFQVWYDHYRYGSILDTGFSQQARGHGFDTPVLQGLDMLLRSPGRGFFWTSPILLLALPGFVVLYRRTQALTIAILVVVVARFLWFAHWWSPGGGVSWGPRLLFPVTALLAIPSGQMVEHVATWRDVPRRRVAWVTIGALAVASAFVSVLSILIGYEQYWNQWTRVPRDLALQRAHSYYWSLAHNPIVGNIHLLRTGYPLAPIHFRHGVDVIGVVALLAAAAATYAALAACREPPAGRISITERDDDPAESLAEL